MNSSAKSMETQFFQAELVFIYFDKHKFRLHGLTPFEWKLPSKKHNHHLSCEGLKRNNEIILWFSRSLVDGEGFIGKYQNIMDINNLYLETFKSFLNKFGSVFLV